MSNSKEDATFHGIERDEGTDPDPKTIGAAVPMSDDAPEETGDHDDGGEG